MVRSKHWWLITLKGLIFIFLGIYILRFPVSGMLGLIVYGGLLLLLSGIIIISFAITTRKTNPNWTWQIGEGFLDIIIALILLLNIGLTVITLPYVFAFFGMLTGIFWEMESFYFKRNNYRYWPIALFAGLFSILIGILIFYRPMLAALTIIAIIGIMFIVQGIFLVIFSLEISRIKN
ncbi:MAG TPA: DUF308 domain-containing protein [Hanamia sp.]|nr:DUF308 domain-containing protein [Hanamia sp.]